MYEYCGKVLRSDPAARGLLMLLNKITASTCNDAAEFTADEIFSNILESNVSVNIPNISNDSRW